MVIGQMASFRAVPRTRSSREHERLASFDVPTQLENMSLVPASTLPYLHLYPPTSPCQSPGRERERESEASEGELLEVAAG